MSDRGFLFLFSVLTIIGSLAYCGWVIATGQALTMDGLFMLLTAGLVAAVFGLYVMFMINRELEAQKAAASRRSLRLRPRPSPQLRLQLPSHRLHERQRAAHGVSWRTPRNLSIIGP
jgi:hypothetical protein